MPDHAFPVNRIKSELQSRNLDLDGGLNCLPLLLHGGVSLGTHDATTPLAASILRVGQVAILDGGNKLGQLALVLGADLGEGEDSGGLSEVKSAKVHQQALILQLELTFLCTTVPRRALPLTMA